MAKGRQGRTGLLVAIALLVAGVLAAAGAMVSLVTGYHMHRVSSEAMSPTLVPGDRVLTASVDAADLARGDLVLVDEPSWGIGAPFFKRVAATGGDRLSCCTSGRLVLNGRPVEEQYTRPSDEPGRPFEVTVPAGRFFLLGDNRGNSLDSRFFLSQEQGTVPAGAVLERAVWSSHGDTPVPGPIMLRISVALGGLLAVLLGLVTLVVVVVRRSAARRLTAAHGS